MPKPYRIRKLKDSGRWIVEAAVTRFRAPTSWFLVAAFDARSAAQEWARWNYKEGK